MKKEKLDRLKKIMAYLMVFSLILTVLLISINEVLLEDTSLYVTTRFGYLFFLMVFVSSLIVWSIFLTYEHL